MTRRALVVAALAAALYGCAQPPPRPTYPDIRFTDRLPLQLDVAALDVQHAYQMPFRAPNVEHLFPVTPSHALENWARDRLHPAGRAGRTVFTILNASVIETELPRTQGISGALTTEPAQRYDLAIEAKLQIIDEHGLEAHTVTVRTTRSQSVLEGITPNDRDKAWYDLTKAALDDFDKQMESEIRNNFGTYFIH